MPVPNTPTDTDSSRTITNRPHEGDPTNYVSSNAHSTGNRSPPKPPKPIVNDSGNLTEPRPLTPQGTGHHESRERSGGSSTTKDRRDPPRSYTSKRETDDTSRHIEQGESTRMYPPADGPPQRPPRPTEGDPTKSHTSKRETEDNSRHKEQGDPTRTHPSGDGPPPRPPRSTQDPRASPAKLSAQIQSSLAPQMTDSSESSLEFFDEQDLAMFEQKQQANAASRPQAAKPDYASAAGGSASRQTGLPQRPSSNAQEPPVPSLPPRPSRSAADNSRMPSLSARYLGKFLPSSASSSDPARDKATEEYQRLYNEHQRLRDDVKRFENENRSLRHANRDIDQDRLRHRDNATALQNELRNVQRELEDYRNLSEIRGKELQGAQVFLTKADLLSASELSQKVNDLNEESFQAAAWFSESLIHCQRKWKSEEDGQTAYQTACGMIGGPAAGILVTTASEPEPNPILVQLVMQIYFAKFCSAKIERWYEGSQETNDFLSTIYGEIRRKEEQAVSGRWRAITHALTRSSPDNWTKDFTLNLDRIMGIAGWELSSPDKRGVFEQQLVPIFKSILDIRIALGEHFTSADIEVFCPPPGAPFDPQCMGDALEDGRKKQKDNGSGGGSAGIILGTACIGLREVPSRDARSGTDNIVLLPKVILQSTIQELLEPPSKTRKGKSTAHAG